MKLFTSLLCLLVVLHCSFAPPVHPDADKDKDSEIKDELVSVSVITLPRFRDCEEAIKLLLDPEFIALILRLDYDVRGQKYIKYITYRMHTASFKLIGGLNTVKNEY